MEEEAIMTSFQWYNGYFWHGFGLCIMFFNKDSEKEYAPDKSVNFAEVHRIFRDGMQKISDCFESTYLDESKKVNNEELIKILNLKYGQRVWFFNNEKFLGTLSIAGFYIEHPTAFKGIPTLKIMDYKEFVE